MAHSLVQSALDQTTDRGTLGRETPPGGRPSEPQPVVLPKPFGRYELQRLLGRGAMGAVYLAHDSQLDRLVALKIPRTIEDDPVAWRDRFLTEARAAATLHHPNICPVFEVGETDSQPYLTMAYIEGETLAARLKRDGSLRIPHAVELVWTISRAMAEAHERGIVHRDLKPANLMLDRRGQPVIMDFGLALRAQASDDLRLTLSGVAMGTPSYMPPEQAGGDHEAIGPASDVYALGVILFELVTGQVPFCGRTFGKLLAQIERDPPPSPQSINAAVDERLAAIILRALAKSPRDRFATAGALADALDAYLAGTPNPAGSVALTATFAPTSPLAKVQAAGGAGGSGPNWRRWAAVAAGLLAIALLGVIIYVKTGKGTLVVELSDPNAKIDVKVNGEEVTLDPDGKSVRIRPGDNQLLEVSGPDYKSTSKAFDLVRNGRTVVQIRLEPKTSPPPPIPPIGPKPPPAPPMKAVAFPTQPTLIELPGWQLMTDATKEQMQTWLDERKQAKHSVLWLDVVIVGEQPVFAAVAALDGRANDWHAFLDLTSQEVNDVVTLMKRLDATNYVVTSISGYVQGKTLTGVALYHRGKADGMAGVPNMFNAQKNLEMAVERGYIARAIRPVVMTSGQLLCGMYLEGAINAESRHAFGLSDAELPDFLEKQRHAGAYAVSVVPYVDAGKRRFAVTCRQDPVALPWEAMHDLTATQLQDKAEELAKKGMAPVSIIVYPYDGEVRYSTVWRATDDKEAPDEK
jgi:hypothetical protein